MHRFGHCARLVPAVHGGSPVCRVTRVAQHRTRVAFQATSSSESKSPSVPQQVNTALQHRQVKLADIAGKLQTTDATQDVIKEVFEEVKGLNEHVQQLAQHMEATDSKTEVKAAEKALKKERKAAEKALKKERKAAEKAAKALTKEKDPMISTGFTVKPETGFAAELNHVTVGTVGGDTAVNGSEFGSDFMQGGQLASAVPRASTAAAPAAVISVCQGSSCQEEGSEKLLEYIKKTAGAELNVVPCKCLGKCEQAPNLRVRVPDQKPVLHSNVQNSKEVKAILQDTKAKYGNEMMRSFAAAS
ncbi:hypothetical protein WJX77_009096 [Trebouxia sp. C0004]